MTACDDRPGYLPHIVFQNPDITGDRTTYIDAYGNRSYIGWTNCMAASAAMGANFDTCGRVDLTAQDVRQLTNEPIPDADSPGLNLGQIDAALNRYGVDLEVRYRLPFADFARKIDKGEGGVLAIETGPFIGTDVQSTAGPINHAIFVPPGWGAMDPAADGRHNYHRYDGRPYGRELLKRAAGRLVLSQASGNKIRLGYGLVYAAFTRDRRSTWTWEIDPPTGHRTVEFVIWRADEAKRECTPVKTQASRGTNRRACTPPRLYRSVKDGSSRSLVRLLGGEYAGHYVHARYATEVP